MDQSTLFIASITFMVVFSSILVALRKVVDFIERHHRNLNPGHRTYHYERYSQEFCGCLAIASCVEVVLLAISLPIMDHKILKMCDWIGYQADCDEVGMIWGTITFAYYGVTLLIACVLIASLTQVFRDTWVRPRREFFGPVVLTLGHLILQFCAFIMLIVFCSDFVFQKSTEASKRDACIIFAACGILLFEIGVGVWLYGTLIFLGESVVLASRRRRNRQAGFPEDVIALDDHGFTEDDSSASE